MVAVLSEIRRKHDHSKNISTIVVFMIPQHEIGNFYWFMYLIRTFTENVLKAQGLPREYRQFIKTYII